MPHQRHAVDDLQELLTSAGLGLQDMSPFFSGAAPFGSERLAVWSKLVGPVYVNRQSVLPILVWAMYKVNRDKTVGGRNAGKR